MSNNNLSTLSSSVRLLQVLPFLLFLSSNVTAQHGQHHLSLRGETGQQHNVVPVPSPSTLSYPAYSHHDNNSSNNEDEDEDESCTSCGSNNTDGFQLFQFDLQTDFNSRETSWILEHIMDIETATSVTHYADMHKNPSFSTTRTVSTTLCLPEGKYRFTIYDTFDDDTGIETQMFGHYRVKVDGIRIAGSNDFGSQDSSDFTVSSPSPRSSAGIVAGEVVEMKPRSPEDASQSNTINGTNSTFDIERLLEYHHHDESSSTLSSPSSNSSSNPSPRTAAPYYTSTADDILEEEEHLRMILSMLLTPTTHSS